MTKARKFSKTPENFGKGEPEGVIAAETANNAMVGPSLVPLLTLSVPGSPTAAVLLGGLLIHGIFPGPNLFTDYPEVSWTFINSLLVGQVLMVVFGLSLCGLAARVIVLPEKLFSGGGVGAGGFWYLQRSTFLFGCFSDGGVGRRHVGAAEIRIFGGAVSAGHRAWPHRGIQFCRGEYYRRCWRWHVSILFRRRFKPRAVGDNCAVRRFQLLARRGRAKKMNRQSNRRRYGGAVGGKVGRFVAAFAGDLLVLAFAVVAVVASFRTGAGGGHIISRVLASALMLFFRVGRMRYEIFRRPASPPLSVALGRRLLPGTLIFVAYVVVCDIIGFYLSALLAFVLLAACYNAAPWDKRQMGLLAFATAIVMGGVLFLFDFVLRVQTPEPFWID